MGVSVNLSASQLLVPNFVRTVARALSRSGLDADALYLEITESVLVLDTSQSIRVLDTLREIGVHISLDDFGTGYSTLSHLLNLPVDAIKIDRSFVDRLDGPEMDPSIVEALINLARSKNLVVVAEGVESETQNATLQEMGCRFAQGYLYSRPVPLQRFVELLETDGTGRVKSTESGATDSNTTPTQEIRARRGST